LPGFLFTLQTHTTRVKNNSRIGTLLLRYKHDFGLMCLSWLHDVKSEVSHLSKPTSNMVGVVTNKSASHMFYLYLCRMA